MSIFDKKLEELKAIAEAAAKKQSANKSVDFGANYRASKEQQEQKKSQYDFQRPKTQVETKAKPKVFAENYQSPEQRREQIRASKREFETRHGSNVWKMRYDFTAGQKEIDDLEAELRRLRMEKLAQGSGVNSRPYAAGQTEVAQYTTGYGITNNRPYAVGQQAQREIDPTDDRIRELEMQIAKKKQDFNLAKQYQKVAAYDDTVKNADFDQYDDYAESDDALYNWINDEQFRDSYESNYVNPQHGSVGGSQNPNAQIPAPLKSEFARKGYDRMNANEIAFYNYYYAKSGKEAAQKYLDTIQETLERRVAEDMYGGIKDSTAAKIVFGAAVGLNQFGSNVENFFNTEDDYIPQSAYQIASRMVREDLADNGPKLPEILGGASLGQIAYDTVTTGANMAPSILVGMATGVPVLGSASMGLSASGGAYQQALNEGYDKNQARGYSILVGASEMAMEKLLGGISAFGGNALGRNAVKNIANADTALKAIGRRIGGSALSEFGEEYLQEVLDPVFSNIMLKTDKEVKPISAEAIYSGILGMLTGAFMEAPFAIYGETKTASTGRKIKEAGGVDSLAKIGNTFAADTVAYKLAGKVNENTGAYTIGQLLKEVDATLTEQNVSEIAEALMKEGMRENEAKQYAEVFAYVVEGGAMPDSLVNAIEADTLLAKAARKVLIDSNTTWNQRTQGYNEVLRKLAMDKVTGKKSGKVTPANDQQMTGKSTAEESSVVENAEESSAETEAAPRVKEIVSMKNGTMKLRLEDGSEVDSGDASYSSDSEALVYETVAQMTNDAEVANVLIDSFHIHNKKSALDAQMYAAGIDEAFRYGKSNIPQKELASSEFASKLTAAQQEFVYRMGQRSAGKQVAKNKATVKKSAKNTKEKTAGKVHFDRKGRTFDKTREASLKTMEQLAAVLGTEFYVYESYVNEDGQRVYKDSDGNEVSAPNGFYDPETGAIHIDLNAGAEGNGTMIFTVAHELTHFIKHWSDDKFKVLANFLVKQYGEKDVSVSELVQKQIDKAKRNDRNLTWDEAYEEMVADSMEAMLTDGNVVQMMADLKQQDKTLWQKICDWFKNLADDLKELVEAYKGYKPDSPEGKMVADMQDTIVILESIYADALAEASENFQRAEKNTTGEGGRKYSFGGRNAVTANNSALQQAEQLAEQGVDNETIRQQTGWYKGMDGKWRYEIDDSRMKITDKIINYMQLGELMQHEALYAAYPDLANIDVVFHSLEEGVSGAYNPQFDSIDISYKLKNDPVGLKDALVHEIQHAIQRREGFTKGATAKSWERKIKAGFDSRRADDIRKAQETERELRRIQNEEPEFYRDMMELDAMTPDLPRGKVDWDTLEKIEDDPVEWKQYDARREELEAKYGDIKVWDMNDLLYQRGQAAKNAGRSGVELYFDTAGEIEARDASSRRSKTVEQRKSSPPRLGNEDTVFAEENAPADDYIPGIVSEKEITENINAIAGMDSVVSINGDEFKMGDGRLLTDVTDFFNSIGGSVYNSRLGDVFLRKRGVRHDLGHGMSDEKAASFAAIPAVLEHGRVAGFIPNKDGKGFDSATVVAPIKIGKEPYMMGVIVHRSNKENRFYVHDVVAIKEEAAPLITGTHNVGETGGATSTISIIRKILAVKAKHGDSKKKLSDRDPAAGRVNEVLQNENAKLKEDVQYLKDLVKLQKTVTGGTKFTKTSVEAMAGNLMKANNVKGNKQELAKLLNDLYEYIAKGEELSWDGVKEMAQPAVDWLRKNTVIKSELSQYAREILHDVRTSRISLDESQTAEAAYRYGSYNDYRKAMMGSVIISKDGVPLDIQWQEWASTYPDIFDAETTASDMPNALADAISSLRNSDLSRAEYAYHADMIEQDLLQQVYDGYWRVSTLYTVADVKQREINALKGKHRQKMNDLRQFHREKTDLLKQEHRDEVKRIRKEYREDSQKKQQEIIQRYQDSRKRSVENRNKTAMRHKIRKTIRELDKLLNRGSKERNVKEGMRDFVAEALASAEVLFIDDYSNEDIIRNGVGCDTEPWESKLIDETQVLMQRKKDLYIKSAAMHEVDDVIAGNTVSFDARQKEADKLDRKIAENMRQLSGVFARERARLNRYTVSSVLENLAKAYKSLGQSDDLYIRAATDEVVYQHLLSLSEQMYGATVKDMTLKQLKELDKAYTMVLTTVQNANKVFREGRAQQLSQIVRLVQSQIQSISASEKDPTAAKEKIAKWIRSFSWNELRPVDAFERLGSDSFTELFWDVIDAQGEYGKLVRECADMVTKARKTANYAKWDMKSATTFKTVDGKEFKLTLGDLMSVYAYSKREQAYDHMTEGGFTFDTGRTYKSKENGKTYVHKKLSSTYRISEENLNRIISSLTAEQRKYVDTMQKFLTEFAKHGNKASRTLYGIDLFTEENYFPLFSEQDFRNSTEQDLNNTQTMVSLKESGMTKQTKPGANNPIVLRAFDDVVLEHLDKMAKYATYVLPIENLQRVFNSVGKDGENNTSTKALISSVFGEEATTYFKNYITDLNGGKQATGAANPLADLFARSKATAVSANLSVVIQQPTSIIRAMNEIDLKYFIPLSTKGNAKNNGKLYDEMMKYAPVAVIKDMGGFDVGSSSGLKGYIGTEETAWDAEKAWKAAQDFFGWGAMQMDRIGWTVIWIAVKRETLKKTGLKYGSQAYLEACGKRFTEVVTKTQVYDSVNSRSGFMRSKNDSLKYLTTFMGEPTVTAGMTYMSHLKLYRAIKSKNKTQIAKATREWIRTDAVLVITALVCGFAKSFVYAMRDDDEDESFMERWFKHFGSAIASDRSFLGLLPVFRDIISIANGYTIERPDLALISDLIAASNKVVDTISDEEKREKMTPQDWYDLAKNHVGAICNFMGAPAANIIRDVEGAIRFIGDLTDDIYPAEMKESFKRGFSGNEEPKRETLYEAIVADDTGRINVLKKSYVDEDGKFNESAYSSAIRKALREYDPRIREAAQAYFDSDLDRYNEIFDDIFHEDHFEHNDIHAAIMSEVGELEKKNAPEEVEEEEEKRPLYSAESYFNALLAGNKKSANLAYDRLVEAELDEGYLSYEAENNVKSALASQIGSAYKDGKINRETALKLLKENTDKDETDVKKWDFEMKFGYPWSGRDRAYRKGVISESELTKAIMDIEGESQEAARAYIKFIELASDHSDLEISADNAADYYEFAQPAKISLEAYMEFKEKTSALTVDKDKNGQTINGSKKKKVMDLINAMSLSVHQKDALYYAAGYKESTIDEAPWH